MRDNFWVPGEASTFVTSREYLRVGEFSEVVNEHLSQSKTELHVPRGAAVGQSRASTELVSTLT